MCKGGEAVSILVCGPENISVFGFYLLVLLQRIYYTFNNSLKAQLRYHLVPQIRHNIIEKLLLLLMVAWSQLKHLSE